MLHQFKTFCVYQIEYSMNIICIDLRMFNHIKLKEICDIYNINYDVMLQNKYDGFAKIWIDKNTDKIIAFNKKKVDIVMISDSFVEILNNINPAQLPKKNMDLDTILEKISRSGIESLNEREKNFLDNLKN